MSLCVFHLSFLSIFNPFWTHKSAFCTFLCVPHFSSFLLLFHLYPSLAVFLFSLFSFPHLIFPISHLDTHNQCVCKKERENVRLVTEIAFFFFFAHGWSVSWSDQVLRNQYDTHTHTHRPNFHTLVHSFYNLIVLHWCFKQLGTIVASTEREKWRGARTDHPVHPGHKTHSELLSHSLLVNFECEQFTVSVSEPLSLYRALFVW